MRRMALAVSLALVTLAAGCKGSNAFLPAGYYSGSTADKQAVNIVIGSKITLDGVEMRFTKDQWLQAVHDKRLRMRCRSQNKQTELSCVISRHDRTETDELLKL